MPLMTKEKLKASFQDYAGSASCVMLQVKDAADVNSRVSDQSMFKGRLQPGDLILPFAKSSEPGCAYQYIILKPNGHGYTTDFGCAFDASNIIGAEVVTQVARISADKFYELLENDIMPYGPGVPRAMGG